MRVRNTKRWGVGKLYPNRDYFLESEISDGLHTIQAGNLLLDVLVRDRGAQTTLIFFHASVTERSTFPVLSGEGVARTAGVNLISISDPLLAFTTKVRLGGTLELERLDRLLTMEYRSSGIFWNNLGRLAQFWLVRRVADMLQ